MTPVLAGEHLSKRFGATRALVDVSFALVPGEVHALVGENGAGKSTLIRLFGGVHHPDEGRLLLDDVPVDLASPAAAFAAGIAVINQEVRVVPALSVAENVMLGHLPTRGRPRRVDRARMRELARDALARLSLALDLDAPAGALTFAERQSVAIARALSHDARALILDEPTAALEEREVRSLFAVLDRLKAQGVAILYVSHRLNEIVAVADRCTVLRDGRIVAELPRHGFGAADLVVHMIGRAADAPRAGVTRDLGETVLELPPHLALRRREIVGLAGLLGSGTTQLLRRLFGAERGARYACHGATVAPRSPAQAIRAGVGMVPNERALGLVLSHSVRDNIVLPSLRRFGVFWRMDEAAIDRVVRELIAALDIRTAGPDVPVGALSGGNQQKVILAKWLAARVDVLLLDEPTQGIDVAAKAAIHRLLRELAAGGGAVLFASSEIHELLALADTVLAMKRHAIAARLAGEELAEGAVREAISG